MAVGPKSEPGADQRIEHHRGGRQRVHRDDDEHDVGFLAFVIGHDDCRRQGRGSAADRGAGSGQRAEAGLLAEQAGAQESGGHRHQHRSDHQQRGGPSQRGDVAERNSQAQQRDRPAQQHLQAKHDAGLEPGRARNRIERDADQQRNDHRGNGKDLRNPRRADHRECADRRRERHSGQDIAQPGDGLRRPILGGRQAGHERRDLEPVSGTRDSHGPYGIAA